MSSRGDKKVQPVLYNDEAPQFLCEYCSLLIQTFPSTLLLTAVAVFLVVDSLKPSEIIVSFTSFSNWLDIQQPVQTVPLPSTSNPSHTALSKTGKESKEARTPDRAPGTADAESDQASVTAGEGNV